MDQATSFWIMKMPETARLCSSPSPGTKKHRFALNETFLVALTVVLEFGINSSHLAEVFRALRARCQARLVNISWSHAGTLESLQQAWEKANDSSKCWKVSVQNGASLRILALFVFF